MPLASMSKVTSICGTPRGAGGRSGQLEVAERLVLRPHLALALGDLDLDRRLVVVGGREDLGPLGRDRGVALDEVGHHAALGLDAQGQRGDVEEQHVLDLALEDAGLQRGADGHDLVGVDALVGLLAAGELLDQGRHGRHPGRATDEDHVVDVLDVDSGVLDHRAERSLGALEQVGGELLELRAGQLLLEVQRAGLTVGDVRQVHRGLARGRQLDLRLLGGLLEALLGDLVLGQVDAVVVLELLDHPLDDALVPVVTTEVVVTGGRLDLDDTLADLEQRDVERAATEVEDEDGLVVALVEAVGQRGRGRLVDDAAHVEARDLAGLLGGLALRVGEVRRHGDHRIGDGLAEVGLRVALQLLQDEGADLLGGEVLVVDRLDLPVGAHVALDRTDSAVDVGDGLTLGDLADQDLAGLGEGHHRRRRTGPFCVGDDGGFATLEDGDDAVRRAEVDADRSCHGDAPLLVLDVLAKWLGPTEAPVRHPTGAQRYSVWRLVPESGDLFAFGPAPHFPGNSCGGPAVGGCEFAAAVVAWRTAARPTSTDDPRGRGPRPAASRASSAPRPAPRERATHDDPAPTITRADARRPGRPHGHRDAGRPPPGR